MNTTVAQTIEEKSLADYLADNGITPAEFAAMIGKSRWSVDRYVRGLRTPRWPVILKIQEATNGVVGPNSWANRSPDLSVLRPRRRREKREPIAA